MPTLDELLNKAIKKTEKKKFSRGNRPDTMLRGDFLNNMPSEERSGKPSNEEPSAQNKTSDHSEINTADQATAPPVNMTREMGSNKAADQSTNIGTAKTTATTTIIAKDQTTDKIPDQAGDQITAQTISQTADQTRGPTAGSTADNVRVNAEIPPTKRTTDTTNEPSSKEANVSVAEMAVNEGPKQSKTAESSAKDLNVNDPYGKDSKATKKVATDSIQMASTRSASTPSGSTPSASTQDSNEAIAHSAYAPVRRAIKKKQSSDNSVDSVGMVPSPTPTLNDLSSSFKTPPIKDGVQNERSIDDQDDSKDIVSEISVNSSVHNSVNSPVSSSVKNFNTSPQDEVEPTLNLVSAEVRTNEGPSGPRSGKIIPEASRWNDLSFEGEDLDEDQFIQPTDGLGSTIDQAHIEPFENENLNKTRFKPSSNLVQTGFKPSSNPVQTRFEPSSDLHNNSSENGLNLVQTRFEPSLEPSSKLSLKKLSPLQIMILEYLNDLCIELRSDVTSPVKIADLVTLCNCTTEGAKTAIKRMIKQNILLRIDYKDGRNGWCQYQISKLLHRELMEHKKTQQNQVQTRFKLGSELGSNAPSKLVSNNINNTNLLTSPSTEIGRHASFSPDLSSEFFDVASINIDPLAKYHISRKQIQDIKNQKLQFTNSTLQDFIDRFAIYASDPKNIRNVNNVPGVFVKMAQMASKGDDPLVDIETEADRLIRERIDALKSKRNERIKHQSELMDLEFENWLVEIQPKGQDEIAPPTMMVKSGSIAQKMILKNYFSNEVWPERALQFGFDSV